MFIYSGTAQQRVTVNHRKESLEDAVRRRLLNAGGGTVAV